MKRLGILLTTTMLAAVLLAVGGLGTAAADPLKNYRLLVPDVSCEGSGEKFTFVINGEGVAGHIIGSKSNIMPVKDKATYTYLDQVDENGNSLPPVTVYDQLGKGKKNGLQRDLKTCKGSVEYEDPELGTVKADFEIEAFFTPRGKK